MSREPHPGHTQLHAKPEGAPVGDTNRPSIRPNGVRSVVVDVAAFTAVLLLLLLDC